MPDHEPGCEGETLTRDSLFIATANRKRVDLPDGRTAYIRKLTQAEVERIKRDFASADKVLAGLRYIVAQCLCDEHGGRLLDPGDSGRLQDVPFDVVNGIATAVTEFSGLAGDGSKK